MGYYGFIMGLLWVTDGLIMGYSGFEPLPQFSRRDSRRVPKKEHKISRKESEFFPKNPEIILQNKANPEVNPPNNESIQTAGPCSVSGLWCI